MKSFFYGLLIILFSGCMGAFQANKGQDLVLSDVQGQFISSPYTVDYSQSEDQVVVNNDLYDVSFDAFENEGCKDISWGSDSPEKDMIGKVRIHLKIDGPEFEVYTQLDFYRGENLIGRTCKQAPRSGFAVEENGMIALMMGGASDLYQIYTILRTDDGRIIIVENR